MKLAPIYIIHNNALSASKSRTKGLHEKKKFFFLLKKKAVLEFGFHWKCQKASLVIFVYFWARQNMDSCKNHIITETLNHKNNIIL